MYIKQTNPIKYSWLWYSSIFQGVQTQGPMATQGDPKCFLLVHGQGAPETTHLDSLHHISKNGNRCKNIEIFYSYIMSLPRLE